MLHSPRAATSPRIKHQGKDIFTFTMGETEAQGDPTPCAAAKISPQSPWPGASRLRQVHQSETEGKVSWELAESSRPGPAPGPMDTQPLLVGPKNLNSHPALQQGRTAATELFPPPCPLSACPRKLWSSPHLPGRASEWALKL